MNNSTFKIHPSVGVARVGNGLGEFYLAPNSIGGLPLECDEHGNERLESDGLPAYVTEFKDSRGAIKRQGAKFRIYRYDNDPAGEEVTLNSPDIKSIEWTAHIANKKAAFWNFAEQVGNTMISPDNTYAKGAESGLVSLRNETVTGAARQKLIIDPGPRTLSGKNQRTDFSKNTVPSGYKFASFPETPNSGFPVDTLGDMLTDAEGRLVIVAAYGKAGGNAPISSYAGADTWHDDTADGQVVCTITLTSGEKITLTAWVLCASTKFAPQLVNMSTLSDTMMDVGIRYKNLVPEMYDTTKWPGGWNPDYEVNYERDILPILSRPKDYIWVANVPSMVAFSYPQFDTKDNSAENRVNREQYLSYWRNPNTSGKPKGYNELWDENMMPLMPLNSGTNSVTNEYIEKFLTLNQTQYFCLEQWAKGKFTTVKSIGFPGIHHLDEASVGNCVGLPMSPGIEVTWSLNNPLLYKTPFCIDVAHTDDYYWQNGLTPLRNETEVAGCEPGDLSKRMAIPWQADFFQCTVQFINFTNETVNKSGGIPLPPAYYSYWWPPQSPWDVISGNVDQVQQSMQGIPAGVQVNYARGINSFSQMITAWKYLGFIVNQNVGPAARQYPYFVEKERNDEMFQVAAVAVGGASVVLTGDDSTFNPVWYLKDEITSQAQKKAKKDYLTEVRKLVSESVSVDLKGITETAETLALQVEPATETEEELPLKVQAMLGVPRSGSRLRF